MRPRTKPRAKAATRTDPAAFPPRLRTRLHELGLTQAEFARRAGITRTAAWRYIHGKTVPTSAAVRARVARAVNRGVDWIDQ